MFSPCSMHEYRASGYQAAKYYDREQYAYAETDRFDSAQLIKPCYPNDTEYLGTVGYAAPTVWRGSDRHRAISIRWEY